jgi:hypothetical protein
VEDGAVVVQADRDAVVADQLRQTVPLQRESDEVVERIAEDRPDRRDDR